MYYHLFFEHRAWSFVNFQVFHWKLAEVKKPSTSISLKISRIFPGGFGKDSTTEPQLATDRSIFRVYMGGSENFGLPLFLETPNMDYLGPAISRKMLGLHAPDPTNE